MDINFIKPTTMFKNILIGELFISYDIEDECDKLFCRTLCDDKSNTNSILVNTNTDFPVSKKATWFDSDDEVTRVTKINVHF